MKFDFDDMTHIFENKDIRDFFIKECVPTFPEYWFSVPASSSGKYHSRVSLGEGGLLRHTLALVRILNYMFEVDSVARNYTSRERDLLRIAGMMHDSRKSGTQEDYERNKHTKFDHPLKAAEVVRSLKGGTIPDEEIELIAHAIESHMGVWSTSSKAPGIVLPEPEDKYQIILHLADYIVSRRDVELLFDDEYKPKNNVEGVETSDYEIHFGKYAGLTWPEIESEDPTYIKWAKDKEGYAFDVLRKYLKEKES